MSNITRKFMALGVILVAGMMSLAAVFAGGYYYVEPTLPNAAELRNIEIQIPLSVYTRDGRLIAQFGEQKRNPVDFDAIPALVVNAFLAAEDDTFFEHPGIDFPGIARAAVSYLTTPSDRVPGASTITQQVAREYFLSRDYSLVRKFREQIMAVRIEREFSKEEILELFLNTTFLGQRSYGVAAAARTYFDKDLNELTVSDVAILAGIPQGPSIMNPVSNPDAARDRRAYVLRRMHELGWITQGERELADAVPVLPTMYGARIESAAPYVAEMVRAEMLNRYGSAAYTAGFRVTSTVDSRLQAASNVSIRHALREYDRRHGYRGPVAIVELPETLTGQSAAQAPGLDEEALRGLLSDYPSLLDYESMIVIAADETAAQVYSPFRGIQSMTLADVAWARPYIDDNNRGAAPGAVTDVLAPGQVIRTQARDDGSLELAQIPEIQGAFVAMDPFDGAIVALNGGYHFNLDNFNRAIQSERQPGSAFKPFTFSAALANGSTVASIFNDSPITIEETEQEQIWRPENSSNRFYGPIPMRTALERSINLASIRVVLGTGVGTVAAHVRRFGFSDSAAPRDIGIALGAGGVSPVDLARGYATFANSGMRVEPYFIERIEDSAGEVVFTAQPPLACYECDDVAVDVEAALAARELVSSATQLYPPRKRAERVVSPQNAYLVADMMQGVIRSGTGRRARALGRGDLAGKTGTTNESRDTWFSGFNGDLVAASWVGFNDNRPLGRGEEGASTALPMWIAFMERALEGVPENPIQMPPGIVEARINPKNGLAAAEGNPDVIFEK
ncbi:MAG TPA: PBP1A family penicillin-binding protein, partial [Gammaproteobacteria bacterium]|nr:PBP1A family penicillin-binding protein [Gammaproteobacteria bacterium]